MRARPGFLIVLLAALFTVGLIRLFSVHFATGDVYPDYSSMRAGPDGAKLLYDSLARTPGVSVSRNYFPLDYLEGSSATILFLGLDPVNLTVEPETYERLANRGSRVVAALQWTSKAKPAKLEDLEKRWHLKFGFDTADKQPQRLYIADAGEWRVLDRADARILAVERGFQKGSVVLCVASRDFANTATVRLNRLDVVSAVIGDTSRVIFDEQHFGVAESGTVVGLARRFRLTGMAIGLAICAALFIWKNSASFPPPSAKARAGSLSGRTSIAGLVTLLRRNIRPAELASTCWNEWLTANRNDLTPARRVRAEAILREHGAKPLDAVREIQTVLHSKGPL